MTAKSTANRLLGGAVQLCYPILDVRHSKENGELRAIDVSRKRRIAPDEFERFAQRQVHVPQKDEQQQGGADLAAAKPHELKEAGNPHADRRKTD